MFPCRSFHAFSLQFLQSVTLSFNYFDANKSQQLQLNEVVKALQHAGFTMDPPVVQAMFKKHVSSVRWLLQSATIIAQATCKVLCVCWVVHTIC